MSEYNHVALDRISKKYGDNLIKFKGDWYEWNSLETDPAEQTYLPDGTPIRFICWMMSELPHPERYRKEFSHMAGTIERVYCPTHQIDIYIGSQMGYSGDIFNIVTLKLAVQNFQTHYSAEFCGLIITRTLYAVGEYEELGWKISAINYPRFPKSIEFINKFMIDLGEYLLIHLGQNRLTIVMPQDSVMLVAPNAEAHPPNVTVAGGEID